MSDIIERAEAALITQRMQSDQYAGARAIINGLLAALKDEQAERIRERGQWEAIIKGWSDAYDRLDGELKAARAQRDEFKAQLEHEVAENERLTKRISAMMAPRNAGSNEVRYLP